MPFHLRTRAAIAVLALAAALPYVRAAGDYFIQDDFGVVALLSQKPMSYFPRWFASSWMDDIWGYTPDEIRPFPAVTYQIAALWGAASPIANHAINMALHAVNAGLVFGLARTAAALAVPAAFVAAVVFAWLPMQAESVAWITGRVDSMPACFYFASFLLFVRWRTGSGTASYAWSVICCFIALFSKQNTITLPAALLLYDVVVRRELPRPQWQWVRPYVPYIVLTTAYLALRWALFGQVAREGMLTGDRLPVAVADLSLHLRRLVVGDAEAVSGFIAALLLLSPLALVGALIYHGRRGDETRHGRAAIFFVIAWIALGAAPTLVAGYASPRHMYLASAGWAVGVGIAIDALWKTGTRWIQLAATAAVVVILAGYLAQLETVVRRWQLRAVVSRQAVMDLEREVSTAPPGSLILAGVPRSSWEFANPHALRPPFTKSDLAQHVAIVTHSSLYCCSAEQWEGHTRQLLREWRGRKDRPPVIALYWDASTVETLRVTEADEPALRGVMEILADAGSRSALDEGVIDTFAELVLPRFGHVPRAVEALRR